MRLPIFSSFDITHPTSFPPMFQIRLHNAHCVNRFSLELIGAYILNSYNGTLYNKFTLNIKNSIPNFCSVSDFAKLRFLRGYIPAVTNGIFCKKATLVLKYGMTPVIDEKGTADCSRLTVCIYIGICS